jgi:AraC family transcriptional regulator
MLQPHIVEKPALTVIGIEASFIHALSPDANNLKVIGALWDRFLHASRAIPNRVSQEMYGIIYERPPAERSHPHELQYIAAVAVSHVADIPDGMIAWTAPAGTYAVFTHRGPIQNIGATMQFIYRDWLPQSGFRRTGGADVEVYDARFHMNEEESETDIWIPLAPKPATWFHLLPLSRRNRKMTQSPEPLTGSPTPSLLPRGEGAR